MARFLVAFLVCVLFTACKKDASKPATSPPAASSEGPADAGRGAPDAGAKRPLLAVDAAGALSIDGVLFSAECREARDSCLNALAARSRLASIDFVAPSAVAANDVLDLLRLLREVGVERIGLCAPRTREVCSERLYDLEIETVAVPLRSEPALVLTIDDQGNLILGAEPAPSCNASTEDACSALRARVTERVEAGGELYVRAGRVSWADYLAVVAATSRAGARPRLLFKFKTEPPPSRLPTRRKQQ